MKKNFLKYLIFLILLSIFILLSTLIQTVTIENFDSCIYKFIENIRTDKLTSILKFFTKIGDVQSLFFISSITVLIMLVFDKKKIAISVALNIIISSISYVVLKNIFQRPRPEIAERLIEENGFSFPSGHSTNNMAFYALAIYLVYKNVKNKKIRDIICLILGIIPIIIGFSRMYLRVHYPSDVLGGFCLGIIVVILFTSFLYKKIRE